ncbi:hypothetical protein B7R21_16625 [Subtercola boreus]|uniref:Uncharacterized protein n=1 Tax=Subtercola boreus TaxID=120213 RepID=A0A3E0VBD7_9MICO|nr:hypothetical protein [Subtercola boreus]RFA07144.1 hypothetical protein B7R21_16625 [Subtercola boreus]
MDLPDNDQARPSTRRNLILALVLGCVLLAVVVGVVVGGISYVVDAVSPPDGCNASGYCHNDNLAAIQTYTGYEFPPGSELLDSSVGANNFTNEWSATAHVALPPGTPLPTSYDRFSTITVTGTDDQGRTLIQVFTTNSEGGVPGGEEGFPG